MAKEYRPVDRDQSFLLPPDMREWLPPEHLAWFVLDVVRALDTSPFHASSRLGGTGRQGYDPDMLLAVLTYAYCHGIRSSRAIERACSTDVAFRVLCAQDVPDHTTIARFRKVHEQALAELFTQVLVLCAAEGMGRFGTVAIDGTKIAANASIDATHTHEHLRRLAKDLVEQAGETDAAEDALFGDERGDELPEQLRDRSGRAGRLAQALAELDAEEARRDEAARERKRAIARKRVARGQERLERIRAERQEAFEQRTAAIAAGQADSTRAPVPAEEHSWVRRAKDQLAAAEGALAAAEQVKGRRESPAQRNLTDPESRVLSARQGWVQGYNCQLAVAGDGLILAAGATNAVNDVAQFAPMMTAVVQAARAIRRDTGRADAVIGTILADAGYASPSNYACPGPDRLIPRGKGHTVKASDRPPPDAQARPEEWITYRLSTAEGASLYKRRAATVEPVNAHLKDRRGLRRFSRRGLAAADSELKMSAWVTNLMKLHQVRLAVAI